MAHNDWVNNSTRMIEARAVANAGFDSDLTFDLIQNSSYDAFEYYVDNNGNLDLYYPDAVLGTKVEEGMYFQCNLSKINLEKGYLQITSKNGYPTRVEISNREYFSETGEDLIDFCVDKNNSNCLIIYFKNNSIPSIFDVRILKWSKPDLYLTNAYTGENNELIINEVSIIDNISTKINFDLISSGMLSSFEVENGLCYDGTSELSYGIKTNQFNIDLNKDNPNTGIPLLKKPMIMANWCNNHREPCTVSHTVTQSDVDTYSVLRLDCPHFLSLQDPADGLNVFQGKKFYFSMNFNASTRSSSNSIVSREYIETFVDIEIGNSVFLSKFKGYNTSSLSPYEKLSFLFDFDNYTGIAGATPFNTKFKVYSKYGINQSKVGYTYSVDYKNICMINLTSIFGVGNEPTKEWCDANITYNFLENSLIVDGKTYYYDTHVSAFTGTSNYLDNNHGVVTKSEILTKLENKPYIQFSVRMDKEFDFIPIGNYFVDTFDYDENNPKFSLSLKDNTKFLAERYFNDTTIVNLDDIETEYFYYENDVFVERYKYLSLSALFNMFINKQLGFDTGLTFANFDSDINISLSCLMYPQDCYYIDLYNKFCTTNNCFIIQDEENPYGLKVTSLLNNSSYNISLKDCTGVNIYNKDFNNIIKVICNTSSYVIGDGDENNIIASSQTPISTKVVGFLNSDYEYTSETVSYSDNILYVQIGDLYTNIGEFTVNNTDFAKYTNKSLKLYVANALYEHISNPSGKVYNTSGIPYGENDTIKRYLHIVTRKDIDNNLYNENMIGQTVYVNDINLLQEQDFTVLDPSHSSFTVENREGGSVVVKYSITLTENDVISYIKNNIVIENSMPSLNSPNPDSLFSDTIIKELYIGAFKVVLTGNSPQLIDTVKYSYSSNTNNFGDSFTIGSNEFIQSGGKVIDISKPIEENDTVNNYIGTKILEEFGKGKKTAKIEWVGSPYIKLFDIVKLDNGINYRVHYIKHKYDGGYRQILHLVEKE